MANIIRCVLPDGVHRFKPFTVADYRDFLLVRNDMQHKTYEEQKVIIKELLA
ncbi:T4 family baseplate hub assembly chaperone, partial [Streptococcus pyogenes]